MSVDRGKRCATRMGLNRANILNDQERFELHADYLRERKTDL